MMIINKIFQREGGGGGGQQGGGAGGKNREGEVVGGTGEGESGMRGKGRQEGVGRRKRGRVPRPFNISITCP